MAHPNIVNVSSIHAQSIGFNLSSTATTTLFTVGDDRVIKVNNIMVANVDGTNAATVDLFVTKAQVDTEDDALVGAFTTNIDITGSFYLAKTITVPADATLVLLSSPIYLCEGDILKGGASAASDLDMFISYELINDA
tara:strand:+ start:580 stop:993 length:414 start_codon:yes stop_codon:yes gene_type:complete